MKIKSSILTVFSLIALIGFLAFASATVNVDSLAGNKQSVSHGSSFDITFNLKNNNPDGDVKSVANIEIRLPELLSGTNSLGSWKSAQVGSKVFEIKDSKVILTGVKISPKTSSEQIKLSFGSKQSIPAGVYSDGIAFNAKYELDGVLTNAPVDPFVLEITVPSAPALSIIQSGALSTKQNSSSIIINNSGNTKLEKITLNATGNLALVLSQAEIASLDSGKASSSISVTTDLSKLKFGVNSALITAKSQDSITSTSQFSITKTFCSAGQVSTNLTLRSVEITEFGEDEDVWKLLDGIKLEVEVKNNAPADVEDVVVEIGMINEEGENVVSDFIFVSSDDEEREIGDIDEGEEETVLFEFKVPADFKTGNYKLVVKAFSKEEGESKTCADTSSDFGSNNFFMNVKVDREDDKDKFIVFDNIKLSPLEATCGEKVAITTDVFNIGTKDQDRVKINLLNSELGLSQNFELKKDLNKGDKERQIAFSFDIPQNAQNKVYNLELSADYDYKKSIGEYDESSDEPTRVPLKVLGCQQSQVLQPSSKKAEITLIPLTTNPEAGSDVILTSIIKNLGANSSIFIVGAKNYESWAVLKSSTDRILTLAPGESKEVKFTFTIKDDAKGEQAFSVEVTSDGKTDSQNVKLNLASKEKKTTVPLTGFAIEGNTLLWAVGIMNVILLILIIIVAVRLSRN